MTFDEADLALFLEVVEQGSITAGAAGVHLSLASASARIGAMEKVAGSPLLRRHRRGVEPTPAGWLLVAHARTLTGQLARLRADLGRFAEGTRATITVLANSAAAATLLPTVLIDFLIASPDVDVDVVESPSSETVAAVAAGRAEVGLVADTVELGRLVTTPIRPDPLVVIAPPGHPVAIGRTVSFAECLAHPFVGFAGASALQEHLAAHTRPLAAQAPRYRARFPHAEAICRAVAAGVGIAVLPEPTVGNRPGLVTVRLSDGWAERTLLLCTRDRAELTPPAAALAAHLTRTRTR